MKRIFLILFISIIPSLSWGIQCMGEPRIYDFKEIGRRTISLPANGVLTITNTNPLEIGEVFIGKGFHFMDFSLNKEVIKDIDNRNPIVKWFLPKETKPDYYTMNFSLSKNRIKSLLGSKNELVIFLRIYSNNQAKSIEVKFKSDLSINCQPF